MGTTLIKAPRTGAREAQTASVELPEKLLPAKSKLDKTLADYVKASLDIEEARGHLARSERDEAKALADENQSDSENMDAVAFAQKSRGVYAARVANREATLAKQAAELSKAISEAANELRGLVNAEIARREGVVGARVTEVLQVGNAVDPRRMGHALAQVLVFSGPIQLVQALLPAPSFSISGNNEHLVGAAKDLLTKFQKLVAEGETL
jgi:hypothetical protein